MVLTALAVVSLALLVCVLLPVLRPRSAFASPDELARWATRLNVTEVRINWLGALVHVVIDPLPAPPEPTATENTTAERHGDTERPPSEVDEALARMVRGRAA